jgi:hypothetical protein
LERFLESIFGITQRDQFLKDFQLLLFESVVLFLFLLLVLLDFVLEELNLVLKGDDDSRIWLWLVGLWVVFGILVEDQRLVEF